MLSADEARTLDRLVLAGCAASPAAGASGLRHARSRGFGIEFQDYRRYQPGDDPRSIDWTVEARLRQLVVRVCRADGHLRLHLLVDISGSMVLGTPSKLACAAKIAAALGYLAVERRDTVGIATFNDAIRSHLPPAAGRRQVFRIFDVLRTAEAGGQSRISGALMDYGGVARGGGLAVVLSDFFQPDGVLDGLRYLLYCGLTPAVVQVVAAEELQPDIEGDVDLVDIEDPAAGALTVDAAAVAAYQQGLARTQADLVEFCGRHGMPCVRIQSSSGFDELLQACLRAGLLVGYA